MQKVINLFMKRKQSTQRVDDMASSTARLALDQRMNRMLALHAGQPAPLPNVGASVSNPIQNTTNS